MARWPDRWIVIPNWDKFQHYKNREPAWIKLHRQLRHKPEWFDLSLADQGLLVNVWLLYAETNKRLRVSDVTRELMNTRRTPDGHRMFIKRSLARLNDAGFLLILASTEKEREKLEAVVSNGSNQRPGIFNFTDLLREIPQ